MDIVDHQKTLYTSNNPTRRWLHTSRRNWILSAIKKHSPERRERAIEVGPGSGVYLPQLLELFNQVIAFDIEDQYLEAARIMLANNPNLLVQQGDITDHNNLKVGNCDLVLCSEVLEHVPPEKSMATILGLRQLLADGGILILSTPHRWSTLESTARLALSPIGIHLTRLVYREPVMNLGHINLLTRSQVRTSLIDAGFEIIEEHAGGLYLPILAELLGQTALNLEKWLEKIIRHSPLHQLLWTQFYIARVRT